ncbi:MAG: phosphatase PAP2 family protein [Proteobacteria bacterium]|nr:phosphatase PAP2 family protein [Pseudomonadota bacterium]
MFLKAKIFCAAFVACAMVPMTLSAEEASCPKPTTDPLVKLLSPPPCDSCAQTKVELDELQTLQRNRTEAQAEHAHADYKISVARFVEGADIKFDAAALEACHPIFDRLMERTKSAAEDAKYSFCRTRPFNLPNNDLRPLESSNKYSPSYPSGHTTAGTALGALLAYMVPEKRAVFLARAADYGHSRMIAGVHFRSDIEAGKLLGMAVAEEEFSDDAQFRTMLPDATKCVRGALGLTAEMPVAGAPAQASAETPAAKP